MPWATAEEHRSIPKDESQMEPGTNVWDFWNELPSRAEAEGSKVGMLFTTAHHGVHKTGSSSLPVLIPLSSRKNLPCQVSPFLPFPKFALKMKWKGGHVFSYVISNNNNNLKLLLNELITYWMPSFDLGIKKAIKPFGPWLIITWVWY